MNETAGPVPWPLSQLGRVLLSAVGGGIAALTATALPHETRIILGLDVFLVIFVALTYLMSSVMTANQCAAMAKVRTPIRHTGVIASIVATLIGIAAIGAMLQSQRGEAHWLRTLHLGGSLARAIRETGAEGVLMATEEALSGKHTIGVVGDDRCGR